MKVKSFKQFIEDALTREMILLREILSNFLYEEQLLHSENHISLKNVFSTRNKLTSELFLLRSQYMQIISTKFSQPLQHLPPLTLWFSPSDSDLLHLLSIQEQVIAILEKINQQNSKNAYLFAEKNSNKRIEPPINKKKESKKVLTKTQTLKRKRPH